MMRFAIMCCALAACVQSNKVVCGDLTCPADYQCDVANNRCISPEQLAACKGLADGTGCTVSTAPGSCLAGVCEPLVCGDGLVSGAEQCDGTNLDGKTCQDFHFYNGAGLACSSACTFDVAGCTGFCGDGQINGGELCDGAPPPLGACYDFGYDAGPLGCSSACGGSYEQCARIGWQIEPIGGIVANGGAASGRDDAWIVGNSGAIEHWNGFVWGADISPVANDLYGVTAVAPGDAWAVGIGAMINDPGVILHRDAAQWQVVAGAPVAQYSDVWAAAHDRVFAATSDQGVLAWDGTSWQTVGSIATPVKKIRGSSATDLWIIENDGSLWRGDGSSWTPAGVSGDFNSLAVITASDVWAVGYDSPTTFNPLIAHWNGTAWTTSAGPGQGYAGVAGTGPKDVWFSTSIGTAYHYDGTTFAEVPVAYDSFAATIVAVDPGSAFAFTYSGFAYRYSGQAYAHYNVGQVGSVRTIWGSSGTDLYITLSGTIYKYDGSIFSKFYAPASPTVFTALAGTSPTDIWATSSSTVYHYSSGTWTLDTTAGTNLQGPMWVSPSEVWVFSPGVAHHGPGTWTDSTLPSGFVQSVSGPGGGDLWTVVGAAASATSNSLAHWNGVSWRTVTIPRVPFAVGARTATDVFVSTTDLHMLHFDGTNWTDVALPLLHPLRWIVPLAADDVFAASDLDLFHFDGTRWSRMRPDLDTTVGGSAIVGLLAPARDLVVFAHETMHVRALVRTEPWVCRASETDCSDAIDDDCDGKIDSQDSDCP